MLYIAPILHLGNPKRRFGYTDDIALVAISTDFQSNCDQLQTSLHEALSWGNSEGITFDPAKSELLHFTRGREGDNRPLLGVNAGTYSISEKLGPLRWLGVVFDRKLTFKQHVQTLSTKALEVGNALKSLGKTTHGVPPHLLQQSVKACVLKKGYYGAETWWLGRFRHSSSRRISNRIGSHIQLLEKVVYSGARAALPAYHTTPTAALLKESQILPPEIQLDQISRTYTA
jgi:hypothetical protein